MKKTELEQFKEIRKRLENAYSNYKSILNEYNAFMKLNYPNPNNLKEVEEFMK